MSNKRVSWWCGWLDARTMDSLGHIFRKYNLTFPLIVLCLLASTAQAGEPRTFAELTEATNGITVSLPVAQLEKARLYKLPIAGLTDDEVPQISADVDPPKGVTYEVSMTVKKEPFVWFYAELPNKYTLSIVVNRPHVRWQQELGYALTSAKLAPDVSADLLAELQSLADKASAAHPTRTGTTVLEVIGPQPPPEPDPTPVPPLPTPGTGTVYAIVIRTVDTLNADQAKVLSDLRQWSDEQSTKVAHLEFPPDAVGPSGVRDPAVATWVSRIPATARQPYLFIAQKNAAGKMLIHWNGELPATAAEVIAKIKEHAQ